MPPANQLLYLPPTGFRSCFRGILAGGSDPHVRHDPWDLTPRLDAKTDLYGGSGQCSVFRMFQGASISLPRSFTSSLTAFRGPGQFLRCLLAGWTALSTTSPGEGTLQVFPDVNLATAYVMLRPFFKPRAGRERRLGFDDWEVDLESTAFPGSVKGKGGSTLLLGALKSTQLTRIDSSCRSRIVRADASASPLEREYGLRSEGRTGLAGLLALRRSVCISCAVSFRIR